MRIAMGCVGLLTMVCVEAFATSPLAEAQPGPTGLPRGLEMLRRSERGFAKATSEIGVRNGFLMFFADDAISPPDTTPMRTSLLARPAPIEPRPGKLEWEPLYGDISRSVDLGYLTGPSAYTDPEGKRQDGVYFSLWRRGGVGRWRVVLDAGIDVPSRPAEFAEGSFRAAPGPAWRDSATAQMAANAARDLGQAEREFGSAVQSNARTAYAARLAEHARMHRDGRAPLVDRDSILAFVTAQSRMTSSRLIRADVAAAADLGWTFGKCEYRDGDKSRRAAFTRVWKRDAEGRWRIVVDLLSPEREP